MLKKEFNPTDVTRIRNLVKGKYGSKTQQSVGYSKKQNFYRSEDYALGYRAKECGFEPCLNMNLLLGHKGSTIYSWFDRPPLQKLLIQNFDNPKHFIEKKDDK